MVAPRGVHGSSGGACMVAWGGMHGCSGGRAWLLPGGRVWDMTRYGDTVNERAVRILLECILVKTINSGEAGGGGGGLRLKFFHFHVVFLGGNGQIMAWRPS